MSVANIAVEPVNKFRYVPVMTKPRRPPTASRNANKTSEKQPPNRIKELAEKTGMTFEEIAEELDTHRVTVSNLSRGDQPMTLAWMEKFAQVFKVHPTEIIWPPPAQGLRRVKVTGALQAGAWEENHEWEEDMQYDVMVPDEKSLSRVRLYAGEIRGDSMNRRYPEGAVVVMSDFIGAGDKLKEGLRYHVRRTRSDGHVEETIKTLAYDDDGKLWLKPESTNPEFQAWIPLDESEDSIVTIIGCVRFVVQREG